MTISKYTAGYGPLTAARELDILEYLLPNGIIQGMAPFVSNPADHGGWTVSLYSGIYSIDGTIIEDTSTYTGLWDLSSYSPGSGTKYFTFYAEYRYYNKTTSTGPNYRFVYGSSPRSLSDRGNATYDPWSADTGHENATAIPLGMLIIPSGATSIDHSSVWMIRANVLSRSTELEKKASDVFTLEYSAVGARKISTNIEIAWDEINLVGYSQRLSDLDIPTIKNFAFSITGPDTPTTFSGPYSKAYTQCLTIDASTLEDHRGVAIVVKPTWDNQTESLEASYVPLLPGEVDDFGLIYGDSTAFTGDEIPYRDDMKNYIVIGYVTHNSTADVVKVSLIDGFVGILTGNEDAFEEVHSFSGASTNSILSVTSTVYGNTVYSNIDGEIDLDDIIDNIAQLASITLDDAYDDTASGGSAGDGRVINVDGGAVKLINTPGVSGAPADVWLSALNVVYGGDYSDFTYSERAIDIAQTDIDPDYTDEYLANSLKPAITYRVPFEYYDGDFYINRTSSVTLKESSATIGLPVVDSANLAIAIAYANSRGIEVYGTFELSNTALNGNKNYYNLIPNTDDDEVSIILNDSGTNAPLSHFGGLAVPLSSQTLKLWIIKAEIGAFTKLHDLSVINGITTKNITGFNPLNAGGYPLSIFQTSDATNSDDLTYVISKFKTSSTPTSGFGGKYAFSIEGDGVDEVELGYIRVNWFGGSAPNQIGSLSLGVGNAGTDKDMFAIYANDNSSYCVSDRAGLANTDRINSNLYLAIHHFLGRASTEAMGDTTDAYIAIANTEETNSSSGRKAAVKFGGVKADGTDLIQAAVDVSHLGSSDDYESQLKLTVNNGDGVADQQVGLIIETDSGEDQAIVKVQKISPIDPLAYIDVNGGLRIPGSYPLDISGAIYARNSVSTNRINGLGSVPLVISNSSVRVSNIVYFNNSIAGPSSTSLLTIAGAARASSHVIGKNTPIAWASLDWVNADKEFSFGESFGLDDSANLEVSPSNGIYSVGFDEVLAGIVSAYNLAVFIQVIQNIGPSQPTLIECNHSYEITPTGVTFRIQFKNGSTWYDIDETSPSVGSGFLGISIMIVGQT